MEIGTWRGVKALKMINLAQNYHSSENVEYYGFDLFDMMDEDILENEVSKMPLPLEAVKTLLENTGATIHLFRGFTKDTMPQVTASLPFMDLVFIDGGHSIETIENDWHYTQQVMGDHTVVIFDDYWSGEWEGRKDAGCRSLIEKIDKLKFDVKILPIQDKFDKDWGVLKINYVQVQRLIRSDV